MDQEWSVPDWAVLVTLLALVLLVVVLVVALLRSRARTTATLLAARSDAVALQAQVDAIEARLAHQAQQQAEQHGRTTRDDHEYVITRLGEDQPEPDRTPAPVVGGPLFADLVLRESAVQAASLAAGLRRALAPETRHRIRFAMKREVKRARKQRRTDVRRARRQAA